MTGRTDRPGGDWSDDRLDRAFAARAAATPPAPHDLGDPVLARVSTPPAPSRWQPFAAAAAALGLTALIAGTSILSQLSPGASTSPDRPSPAPSGDAPTATGQLNAILGLLGELMTVSQALEARSSGVVGRELAVAGYLSPTWPLRCRASLLPRNPTLLGCPDGMTWVMEEPERLTINVMPTGPAFRPSFAIVEAPSGPTPQEGVAPVPVVLVGHFDDRRAALCPEDRRGECAETFVVDHVASVNGVEQPVQTWRLVNEEPKDLVEDVDVFVSIAAPEAVVVSRQFLTVAQAFDIEPALRDDPVLSAWDPNGSFWLVTAVDSGLSRPAARTFALIDGSNWVAEVASSGTTYLERTAAPAPSGKPPLLPPGDPSAFDGAPTSVLGIPVQSIQSIQRQRSGSMFGLGRDELAIRAWYIGPPPGVFCSVSLPALHPPTPPCDEARHWLLDDPQAYGIQPGQRRSNPAADHYPPVVNPLLPVDVAFDVGDSWRGDTPVPQPVVVLGHLNDNRVDTYAGNLYFVIDALAWTPGRSIDLAETVVRLTPNATEDVASVLARIDTVAQAPAVATWATVIDAADFRTVDPRADDMPELKTGAPVWMVRRLIQSEMDGRPRLANQWFWTADRGDRIWWIECPDCGVDLATTLDIHDLDANTELVRIYDYDDIITAFGPATGMSGLKWIKPHGNATDHVDVARGRSDREVVIRWTGSLCPGVTWNVRVHDYNKDGGFYFSVYIREDCEGSERLVRRIVLEFDHTIDIRKIDGPSCCG